MIRLIRADGAARVLKTLAAVGVAGALVTGGALSAFSSQADSGGNSFAAGDVTLTDNDAGGALYSISNGKPGSTQASCIRVAYAGSLDATVKLYTPSTIGSLGQYVNFKVESGTQASPSFPSCTGFSAETTLFDGTLAGFQSSHSAYSNGLQDFPGTSATKWVNGDAVVYRVTATLQDNAAAQGLNTGSHTIRWEAQNQ